MSYTLFQVQCRAIELTLALAEREYLRYPPGTIIDGVNVGGQFATGKKSSSTSAPKEKPVSESKPLPWAKTLEKAFARGKDLEAKVGRVVNNISKEIIYKYGIAPEPLTKPEKTFTEKLKEAAAKYGLIEAQISKAPPDKQKELLENLIKAAIPLAIAISLTVGAEAAIGLFLGQTVGELLIGSAIGLGVSVGVDKSLDLARIENPIVRAGLQLAAGVATGGIVSKVARASALKFGRFSETAKEFIEQATAVPGIRSKIKNPYRTAAVLDKDGINSQNVLDALRREVEQEKRIDLGLRTPHTFSKRLDEYVELSLNKKTGIGTDWRRGIVDAELKYGEAIEKIHSIAIKDAFAPGTETVYSNFISTVKAGKNGSVNAIPVTPENVLESQTIKIITKGKRKYKGYAFDIEDRLREVRNATTEASQMSNTDLGDIYVGHIEGKGAQPVRGYALQIGEVKYMGIGFVGDPRNLAFHETGHFIEDAKELAITSVDYIKSRSNKNYSAVIDGAKHRFTDFIDLYTGKTYSKDGAEVATEVVSTGLENLSSFQRLHRIAREDPDHLRYTLFALDTTK